MNDYKELIHSLDMAGFWLSGHSEEKSNLYFQAADAIEELVKDNNVLTKERDAAISEIPRACSKCEHNQDGHFRTLADGKIDDLCRTCFMNGRCNFKWRGVQE